MPVLQPAMITVDTTDALPLARWWATQTGGEILEENDGWFVVVALPAGPRLGFQKVADPTPGKNRLHVDFVADDLDGAVALLREAGAGHVGDREMPGFRWVTLSDPDGNEFCVAGKE
ncbi:VOC family protein [Nocardioides humi]|uniref:VOC family protein n=1 Tax=Nocardioides humi TaxID=449461 RepID=A0ABN2B953_9ACTN|nr:VOC family protein [Nocardioides humi]